MIAVGYSIDASIAEHFRLGKLKITVQEVNTIARLDKVLLFTHDSKDFSNLFQNTKHIPFGRGSSLFLRKLTAPIFGFLALLKYRNHYNLMRFFGVACPHAVLIKRLFGKKLVVSYHYEWARQACILTKNPLVCVIANMIENSAITSSDLVIALTPTLAKLARRKGAKNVIIIPNCIPHALVEKVSRESKESSRKKLGIPPDKKILLFVGRLAKIKNVDLIIRAFSLVAKQFYDANLYIIGDGPMRRALESITRELDVSDRVIFTGFQPVDKVYLYMKAADVLVNASTAEGHPRALIEAMIAGTPVIASRVIGNVDVIRDSVNGLLFEPFNVNDLANKITELLSNPEKIAELGRNAARMAVEKYDCDIVNQKYLSALKQLL